MVEKILNPGASTSKAWEFNGVDLKKLARTALITGAAAAVGVAVEHFTKSGDNTSTLITLALAVLIDFLNRLKKDNEAS